MDANQLVDEGLRVDVGKVESLIDSVGELVILQSVLKDLVAQTQNMLMVRTLDQLGKVLKDVQTASMSLRMIPVKPLVLKLQRIVRDTAKAVNKDIDFSVSGDETEIDKVLLDKITDPLVHIVRNCCDHGIETRDQRRNSGKSERGQIEMKAYHQGGRFVVEIEDDGGGIDVQKVRAIAVQHGMVAPGASISDAEATNLIFAPGFSTKETVTAISGRGVGLDVVRHGIDQLQGQILIDSELQRGTKFKIILPLTLAIIDGLVVMVGQNRYVLPLSSIHETFRFDPSTVRGGYHTGELLLLKDQTLNLFRLADLLGELDDRGSIDMRGGIVIVARALDGPFAVVVEDILGHFPIVTKDLAPELRSTKGIAGSTILGDGKPAFILDLEELIKRD